jgi:hypothetical protein
MSYLIRIATDLGMRILAHPRLAMRCQQLSCQRLSFVGTHTSVRRGQGSGFSMALFVFGHVDVSKKCEQRLGDINTLIMVLYVHVDVPTLKLAEDVSERHAYGSLQLWNK